MSDTTNNQVMFVSTEDPTSTPLQRFISAMPRLLEDFGFNQQDLFKLKRDALPSISAHKKTGTRRFEVRKIPWLTIKTCYYLIDAVNPSAADDRSIYDQFVQFRDKHVDDVGVCLYSDDEMLLLFCVDIMIQGIKASSAETYMAAIVRMSQRRGHRIKGPLVKDLRKIFKMLRLDDEVDHAVDISEEMSMLVLQGLSAEAAAMCLMLIITGARVSDLLNLDAANVMWGAEYVTIHFKCTKNRRNPSKVFTANYPYAINMEIGGPTLVALMEKARCDGPKTKLFSLSVDAFNAAVRSAWKTEWSPPEWQGSVPTSYSFRRMAIQRFVRQAMTQENGKWVVKWAKAMAMTGHLRLETLRTRYLELWDQTLEGAEIPSERTTAPHASPHGSHKSSVAHSGPPPLLQTRPPVVTREGGITTRVFLK